METQQIKLGKVKVPILNFREGGSIPQIGYGTYELRQNDCITGVTEALKIGYTHIDTASVYRNEQDIAKVIHNPAYGIKREDLFITSKISPGEQGYEQAKKAVQDMLTRLNIKYLDCVLIHWPGVSKLPPNDPKNAQIRLETWKALIELRKAGIIKHIGVSNFNINHLQHLIEKSEFKPEMNQFEIHPLCFNKKTIEFCQKNGILVEAYSPLARQHEKVMKHPLINQIAQKYKKTVPQVILRWALQNNMVIIPKSKTPQRIQENIDILDFVLTPEELEKMNSLDENLHTCWDPISVTH
ncbi:hypothetical protein ABPG74_010817 [Tetrahymena malaccensis]